MHAGTIRGLHRNHRNRIGFPWLAYAAGLGLIVLGWGGYFAYLKNQHHMQRARLLELQRDADALTKEIDLVRGEKLRDLAPEALGPRVATLDAGLVEIPPSAIVRLRWKGAQAAAPDQEDPASGKEGTR